MPATGKHGRVTSDDVKRFAGDGAGAAAAAPAPGAGARADRDRARGGDEERIPFRGMRKRIAENMTRSEHTAAHFTYVEEVDMTELVARARARQGARRRARRQAHLPAVHHQGGGGGPQEVAACSTRRSTRRRRRSSARSTTTSASPPRARRAWWSRSCATPTSGRSSTCARDRAARRGGAQRHRDPRRAHRLDLHDQLARQARRRARDADHQLPRGRASSASTRSRSGRRCATARSSSRQLMNLSISRRSPPRRRLGRRDVPAGRQGAARGPDARCSWRWSSQRRILRRS